MAAERLKYCDVVMKGGITSGVVYPPAISELALKYQFKNIGGASAGAIAAAATAAAECGRLRGAEPAAGFPLFQQLPNELAVPGFLIDLFSPDARTAKGFRVLLRVMQAGSVLGKVFSGVWSLVTNFAGSTFVGILISLVVAAIVTWLGSFTDVTPRQAIALIVLALGWTAFATLTTVLAAAAFQTARGLATNGYGFCGGFSKEPGSRHLTNWMYEKFNRLAYQLLDRPLTFRDLWTADGSDGSDKAINLEVITTNLTHLSPYTIPFQGHTFYFDPAEWRELFPDSVMKWLLEHPARVQRPVVGETGTPLVPLPDAADLPVVVAVRLSLSFPGLVSAVPLYAVDFSLSRNQRERETFLAERCWFSDGGICSNFPVHFFDNPIPRWPTFAINLKQPHPEYDKAGSSFVYLPSSCRAGQLVSWQRFNPTGNGFADLIAFIAAILNTMEDWRDNLQTRMPGYRNRIVHISLKPDEGGLNLTMPPELIKTLTTRGATAGRELRTQFNFPQHVWTRYRTTMAMLDAYMHAFADDYNKPSPDATEVWDFITGASRMKPECYPWKEEAHRAFAIAATQHVAELADSWTAAGDPFDSGAPRPEPQLRPTPRY